VLSGSPPLPGAGRRGTISRLEVNCPARIVNGSGDNVDPVQHLRLRDGQWRSKRQHVAHRRLKREPTIKGGIQGRFGQVVVGFHAIHIAHQLDAEKEPAPTHIADHGDAQGLPRRRVPHSPPDARPR
jgi:hypothetical protein